MGQECRFTLSEMETNRQVFNQENDIIWFILSVALSDSKWRTDYTEIRMEVGRLIRKLFHQFSGR